MSIELRPLGVACNLSCHYCYQNPQRDAGNQRMLYDLEKMKAEAARVGGPFTLFGGEPLLMHFEDLENLLAWGMETFGRSSIQTNGTLIEDRHIDAFRRYNVAVGISIDGPGELNDARWHRGLDKTRRSTSLVEANIEKLCRVLTPPGLIITLHKGNATSDKLPRMADWVQSLYKTGVRSIRLHLLEVDHASVREGLALSARENIEAILTFAKVQESLPGMRMDLFEDMEHLLSGDDAKVGCIWRACDPYTTAAVRGIEGNGQSSNCGRTNKEGIGFIKADRVGFERQLALYRTPQSQNGCAGCRFFLMCKGQCPGTAIDGDWRNRTEHCEEWMHLFSIIERRMILAGKYPLTIQPVRLELERRQMEAWERGANPTISRLHAAWNKDLSNPPTMAISVARGSSFVRISWVSEAARTLWQPRLERIRTALEEMTVYTACAANDSCAVRRVPASSVDRLHALAAALGLSSAVLPSEALPPTILSQPNAHDTSLFLAGPSHCIAQATAAWESRDFDALHQLLDLPSCCLRHNLGTPHPGMLASPAGTTHLPNTFPHPLLSPLGLFPSAMLPCRPDCSNASATAQRWHHLAVAAGFSTEASWLNECLAWPIAHSELHGIAEVKTPLFKLCFQTPFDLGARVFLRSGSSEIEEAAHGLTFPYAPLTPPAPVVQIEGLR